MASHAGVCRWLRGSSAHGTEWVRHSIRKPKVLLDIVNQPPVPRPHRRYCGDEAFIWLATTVNFIMCLFSIIAVVLCQLTSYYPIVTSVTSGLLTLEIMWFGEWALKYNRPLACYAHSVLLSSLNCVNLWAAAMAYVELPRVQEFTEENWFYLQDMVLPFTTLLDQKNYLATFHIGIFGLGVTSFVLTLHPLGEAWKALGGTMRMVQSRFGMLLPEFTMLFLAAVATIAFDEYAAAFGAWSTPYGVSTLVWQSACAGLALIGMFAGVAAAAVWGVSFLTHAVLALIFLPLGVIMLISSSITLNRAAGIESFVTSNWAILRLFVPPRFSALGPDKYALASQDPTASAAASGLMLSFLLLGATRMHLRCASILASVGQELSVLTAAREVSAQRLSQSKIGSKPGADPASESPLLGAPGNSYGSGAGAAPADTEYTTLPLEDGQLSIPPGRMAQLKSIKFETFRLGDYSEEAQLADHVYTLPVREFFGDLASDARDAWRTGKGCIIAVALVSLVFVAGMAGGLARVSTQAQCGILASGRESVTYNTTLTVEDNWFVNLTNLYDRGAIEFYEPVERDRSSGNLTIEVTYMAAPGVSLPSYQDFLALVKYSDWVGDDDDMGWGYTDVSLSPPAGPAKNCYAAHLRVFSNAAHMRYLINSRSVLVNITGNLPDVLAMLNGETPIPHFPAFSDVDVTTDTGAIVVSNTYVDIRYNDPDYPPPKQIATCNMTNWHVPTRFRLASRTGDIVLDNTLAPGISAETSGTIRSSSVFGSILLACAAITSDISFITHGGGKIAISQAFAAYNAQIRAEDGLISMTNAGLLMGDRLDISSKGPVYLSNFIQACGNQTWVSSASKISGSAVITNFITMTTTGSAPITAYEIFAGLTELQGLIKPPVGNYTLPSVTLSTENGGITLNGLGGNSASPYWASVLSAHLTSNLGDVKLEMNGGGFNGNYTVTSRRGQSVVEIVGVVAPNSGRIGKGSSGLNELVVYSEGGDVQFSQLASPL